MINALTAKVCEPSPPPHASPNARRSVGGGVAALSFDDEFQRRRIDRRREAGGGAVDRRSGGNGARVAARMMVHAVRDLGGGIYHGVTGVVVEPYKRARVSKRLHHALRCVCVFVCRAVMVCVWDRVWRATAFRSSLGRRFAGRAFFVVPSAS